MEKKCENSIFLRGHSALLHFCSWVGCSCPGARGNFMRHQAPPFLGAGSVQVCSRFLIPLGPHDVVQLDQVDHSLHPPSTGVHGSVPLQDSVSVPSPSIWSQVSPLPRWGRHALVRSRFPVPVEQVTEQSDHWDHCTQ